MDVSQDLTSKKGLTNTGDPFWAAHSHMGFYDDEQGEGLGTLQGFPTSNLSGLWLVQMTIYLQGLKEVGVCNHPVYKTRCTS